MPERHLGGAQSQLAELSRPFPASVVESAPGKYGTFVNHAVVTERALATVGPFSLEVRELIRDSDGTLTGCLVTVTAVIDGRTVSITEVGDVENPENAKTDGERCKLAVSDGIKRAWARLGLGSHLWSGGDRLHRALVGRAERTSPSTSPKEGSRE